MQFLANYRLTSAIVVTRLELDILLKGVGFGVVVGLLGAFYPAFIASRLSPAIALRHE
jgi:ABC-type antimicrobial peptide transport system permease subunit